ncbi:hypothetical protein [Agromyces bauzanensis]
MSLAFWACAAVTVISAGVSFGYAVAGLRAAGGESRSGYQYAFARSAALLVVAVVALPAGSAPLLVAIAIAMTLVQAIDAIVGSILHDHVKTIGPAVTALLNAACLVWLLAS